MKTLKRKYARITEVLVGLVIVMAMILPFAMEHLGNGWKIFCFVVFQACVYGMLFVRICFLRCPYCGKGFARVYWSPNVGHEQYCVRCGKAIRYDDEVM